MIETILGLSALAAVKYGVFRFAKMCWLDRAQTQAEKLEKLIAPLPAKYAIKRMSTAGYSEDEMNKVLERILDYDASGELFNNGVGSTPSRVNKLSRKNNSKVMNLSPLPLPPRRK